MQDDFVVYNQLTHSKPSVTTHLVHQVYEPYS